MGCRSPVEVESSVRRFCEGGDRASCAGRHKQARSRRRNRRNAAGGGPRDGHGGRTTRREPTRQPTPARSPPAATSPPPARAAGWLRPPTHRPRAGPFPPKTLTSRGVAAPAALAAAAAAGRGDGRRHGAAPAPAAVLPAGGRREEREPRAPSPGRRVSPLPPSSHTPSAELSGMGGRGATNPARRRGARLPTSAAPSSSSHPRKFRANRIACARSRGLSGQWVGAITTAAPNRGRKGGMRDGEGKEEGGQPSGPPR